MMDIKCCVKFLITRLLPGKLLLILLLFTLLSTGSSILVAQAAIPPTAIMELKDGYLLIRMPANKAKIDTLGAMTKRAKDPKDKARFEKEWQEAIGERDTMLSDYISAFKVNYHFSKVAYFFDYDARDLKTASYYNLDGVRISTDAFNDHKLFYLYFERTSESKMDALVLHDRFGGRIPKPFPNDFTQGGINVLFLKLSGKKFPTWRVGKMDKALFKYYESVKSEL